MSGKWFRRNQILIDVTRLLYRSLQGRLPTGVDRVSLEYVRHFGGCARALIRFCGRWIVLSRNESQRLFDQLLCPDDAPSQYILWLVGKGYLLNWTRPEAGDILLNTGHSGLEHPSYAYQIGRYGLRSLFFLHDLIPISHPEYSRPGEAEKHRRRIRTMLLSGSGIVVNSLVTGEAMEKHARVHNLPVPRWTVAPLAVGTLPTAAERLLAEPYFVVLGTIEPRKNHLLLLHVWRQLVLEQGGKAPRLVVIGQRGWECEQVVDLLERCVTLRGFVIERNDCKDLELMTWLRHAQALLFPSFVEGYGMPLVEALSLGLPVIASDLPVFREVAGEIPEYRDPLDGRAWKEIISDCLF